MSGQRDASLNLIGAIRWTLTEYTYETKRECDERAHKETRGWVALMQTAPNAVMTGSYVCYPDTVDPRGPKGSGR
jgi:hypothetical protein